jgi:hypothetical protein
MSMFDILTSCLKKFGAQIRRELPRKSRREAGTYLSESRIVRLVKYGRCELSDWRFPCSSTDGCFEDDPVSSPYLGPTVVHAELAKPRGRASRAKGQKITDLEVNLIRSS